MNYIKLSMALILYVVWLYGTLIGCLINLCSTCGRGLKNIANISNLSADTHYQCIVCIHLYIQIEETKVQNSAKKIIQLGCSNQKYCFV
jgi:DNA-directed RNA polymerase subunit RPC12/RpoP